MNAHHGLQCVRTALVGGLVLTSALFAQGQPAGVLAPEYGLKGYTLLAELTDCPASTIERKKRPAGDIDCLLPADTLAGEEFSYLVVNIWQGRIAGVYIKLARSGVGVALPVVSALEEKFGPATSRNATLSRYTWTRLQQRITVDGLAGWVSVADIPSTSAARKAAAGKNKDDL